MMGNKALVHISSPVERVTISIRQISLFSESNYLYLGSKEEFLLLMWAIKW